MAVNAGVVPVSYGYVNLNIDKAWFASKGLALPTSLADLAKPAYAKLLVVPNPATSSPGQAFLLATIAGLGEAAGQTENTALGTAAEDEVDSPPDAGPRDAGPPDAGPSKRSKRR